MRGFALPAVTAALLLFVLGFPSTVYRCCPVPGVLDVTATPGPDETPPPTATSVPACSPTACPSPGLDDGHVTDLKATVDENGRLLDVDAGYLAFNDSLGFFGAAGIGGPWSYVSLGPLVDPIQGATADEIVSVYYQYPFAFAASKRHVKGFDLRDATTVTYTGIPTGGEIAGMWGGGTDLTFIAYNAPTGTLGTGIYSATATERNFTPTFTFSSTSSTLAIDAVSELVEGRVLIGHRGGGFSISSDGGRTWTPWNTDLTLPVSVRDIYWPRLDQEPVHGVTDKGFFSRRWPSGPWTKKDFGASFVPRAVGGWGSTVAVAGESLGAITVQWSTDSGATYSEFPGPPGKTVYSLLGTANGYCVGSNAGLHCTQGVGAPWRSIGKGMRNGGVRSLHVTGGSPSPSPRTLAAASTLYVGSTGNRSGVYKSTDGGKTYAATGSAIDNQIVWDVEEVSGTLIAALNTGVARSTDGGATWTVVPPAAGIPAGRQVLALETVGNAVIAATYLAGAYRSTDAGATWQAANAGLPANAALYSLHETAGAVIAGGVNRVFRSTNGGVSWTAGGVPSTAALHAVYTLAGTDAALYAGILDTAGVLNGVSRSTDGGMTWTPASGGLPRAPVNALLQAGGALFAGSRAGLYRSVDGGASWSVYGRDLFNTTVYALGASGDALYVGTASRGVVEIPARPRTRRLIPIVLDVYGAPPTHFTTELTLTNRGTTDAAVSLQYTASIGSGSGSASETVRAGQQLVIPDAIAYLIGKGVPIPAPSPTSGQAGTLLVTFDGLSDEGVAGVTARTATATTAPEPFGRAGLAYSGVDPALGSTSRLTVFGLRSNAADRSNVAVFNTSAEPVSVRVTAHSGSGEGNPKVVGNLSLPPWGWQQLNEVLQIGSPGFTNGWVVAERTSATGSFGAYGVVNDRRTGDGSYVLPVEGVKALRFVNVPVLVETGAFSSELVLANVNSTAVELDLSYRESLSASQGAGGTVSLTLAPGEQRIIPGAIDFLRSRGAAIGPKGGASYVGSLHAASTERVISGVYAGARTASPSASGGQYGLFTGGAFAGSEARSLAYIYGLRADETNRANVAVAHTGGSSNAGPITLELTAYDGEAAGVAKGSPELVTLQPGQWYQSNSFLANRGVRNGWVRVRRTAGSGYFLAYGIVNDGGAPGQRTGDGAFVPMEAQDATLYSVSPAAIQAAFEPVARSIVSRRKIETWSEFAQALAQGGKRWLLPAR